MKDKNSVNIYDVAKRAGVSRACVSKYLNNQPYVSIKTKKIIGNAIKELNYQPSAIARSLSIKKTNNIGLIIIDITQTFQTEIIRGIEEYKVKNYNNYNIILFDMLHSETSADIYVDTLLRNRVEGILTTTDRISIEKIKFLKKIKLPTVFIGIGSYVDIPNIKVDYVTIDDTKGAYLMTKYLLEQGHRKIIYVAGPVSETVTWLRISGYREALKKSGIKNIKEKIIFSETYTINSGFKTAEKIFSLNKKPTAIFCFNDDIAYGIIDYCVKNGIRIPEDISIAGFDNAYFSSLYTFNLSTVSVLPKDYGEIAAKILFDKIYKLNKKNVVTILEPELIIRKSILNILK